MQYSRVMEAAASPMSGHIRADSVVDLAYERIRSMLVEGEIPPGARLGQVELAEQLGISRTPIREALRRLTGEGLAEFLPNRGFRAASPGLDDVLRRLEVRSLVEPGIARLAAAAPDRRRPRGAARVDRRARRPRDTRIAAHDASRDFHVALAHATGNRELVAVIESLWIVEIGRRLLAARATSASWKRADVAEHRALLAAVPRATASCAARLMAEHIGEALQHWEHEESRRDADAGRHPRTAARAGRPAGARRPRGACSPRSARVIADAWASFDAPRAGRARASTRSSPRGSRAALPEPPGDAEAALADAARVLDASVSPSRPLFLAYIGSSGLEIGVLASALAATYDANLATSAGGADRVEEQALRWVADFVGFPLAEGAFTSGGMTSNLTALLAARERALPGARHDGVGARARRGLLLRRGAPLDRARRRGVRARLARRAPDPARRRAPHGPGRAGARRSRATRPPASSRSPSWPPPGRR